MPKAHNLEIIGACIIAILLIIFGTIFGVVQQTQRRNANWPQIQLAEDVAYRLGSGDKPTSLIGQPVLIDKSLDTFTVIYDRNGKIIASSGYLTGTNLPAVPFGVLTASNGQDYHAVTWQPLKNVRIAAVAVAAKQYYVLSGRSLVEVEKNIGRSLQISFLGWVVSLAVCLLGYTLIKRSTS